MRRQIMITLVLIGVAVLAALQLIGALTDPGGDGSVRNVRFSDYAPLLPPTAPNTAVLQASLDRISRTALDGQWAAAAHEAGRLENLWLAMRAGAGGALQIEQDITAGITELQMHVLARDAQAVLETAERLTAYFGRLR